VTQSPHWEKISFRVKERIFCTVDPEENTVVVKLSLVDQEVFAKLSAGRVGPVLNKWGKQGWTQFVLSAVSEPLLADLLTAAYCLVAPNKWGQQIRPDQQE
jgi:hypothetical protein